MTRRWTLVWMGAAWAAALSIPACLPSGDATTAASPEAVSRCETPPRAPMVVFERVPQDAGTRAFRASLERVVPPPDSGLSDLILAEPGGEVRRVAFSSPAGVPPLADGTIYAFRLDYVGGEPDAAAIVIEDDEGLVYAAATDQRPGAAVLRDGLAGWTISLLPAECASRLRSECFDAVRNAGLAFEHDGQRQVLFHGESADLGRYRVDCLVAQEVDYSASCADAGVPGISWAIARR